MDIRKVKKEKKRLLDLLDRADVPQQRRDALAPVIENMAFQRAKLDEARAELQDAPLVVWYSNGGGQEGERENPLFKAYTNLWRSFMVGFEKYAAALPAEFQKEAAADCISILDQVRQMKKGSA